MKPVPFQPMLDLLAAHGLEHKVLKWIFRDPLDGAALPQAATPKSSNIIPSIMQHPVT